MAQQRIRLRDLYGEPFRLFFPLGWAAGLFAVAMWLLYFQEAYPFYPGIAHARLMTLGFMGAFVVGFLGTAGPRMLEVRPLSPVEFWGLAGLWLVGVLAYAGGWVVRGDAAFLLFFATFVVAVAMRFPGRKDLPPPTFVLVLWGFVHLFVGLIILLAAPAWGGASAWNRLGADLLYQGFLLCPMLGIGTFLFPRLLGYAPMKVTFPGDPRPTPAWKRRAGWAFLTGLLLFLGFWIETWVRAEAGIILRVATAVGFVAMTVPFWRPGGAGGWYSRAVRVGLIGLLLGLVIPLAGGAWRLGGLHVAFMAGFGMLTFLVATRVVLGHSGRIARFQTAMPFAGVVLGLTVLAVAVRLAADLMPAHYLLLLSKSALLWLAAGLVWGVAILPRVLVPDDEPE